MSNGNNVRIILALINAVPRIIASLRRKKPAEADSEKSGKD